MFYGKVLRGKLHEIICEKYLNRDWIIFWFCTFTVAPIIGGIALLAIIIIALCCFMRRRARYARSTSSRSVRTAYDNNIYDIPADVTDKPDKPMPPVYTELPLPQNPPAYSRTGSFKGSVYESEAPPSYSNPEYETVGEGMKPIETITQ